jgi:hypothetical protein
VAGLQARSPLRSAHPPFFINKLVSLTVFLFLLGVGWVALCYVRAEMTARSQGATETGPSVKSTAVQINAADASQFKQPTAPVRMVYRCAGDDHSYHTAAHVPQGCERTALSEDAALQRGLKHCQVCMPE